MGTTPITREVHNAADWLAADLAADPGWCRELTGAEIAELDAALAELRRRHPSLELNTVTPQDFPLGGFTAALADCRERVIDGWGIAAWTGFPVDRYSEAELRALWWGLAIHLGTPVAQSWRGDLIGDVADLGTGITGKAGRGYTSNVELGFHSDACDVSALFFLRTAKSGGTTSLASSVAVHNEIARRRPDLLDVLYQPFTVSWQSNELPGQQPWYDLPVYGRAGDDVACALVSTNILLAHQNVGAPPLRPEQIEAVNYLCEVAREPQFAVVRHFEPGAMLFCNSHTTFHKRTAFEDWPEPERRRHLLRMWLSLPNTRRLPASFAPFFGDVSAGAVRGGYQSRTGERRFRTS